MVDSGCNPSVLGGHDAGLAHGLKPYTGPIRLGQPDGTTATPTHEGFFNLPGLPDDLPFRRVTAEKCQDIQEARNRLLADIQRAVASNL